METNLEDFLNEDLWKYFNSDKNDAEEEYNNENEDAVNDDLNNENYYGENAGEVLDDEEESDKEDNDEEDYTLNNSKAIGKLGEKFAKKYLEELFEINNLDLKVKKPENSNDEYDLEIYGNGKEFLIEVKLSTSESHPIFHHIHLNNKFDYLLLIWKPENKFYFAFILKEDLINGDYATLENTNRKDEDNLEIERTDILDEDISKNLSRVFNLDKDLSDERKLEIYKEAENEVIEEYYKDIDMNTLYGKLKMLGSGEKGDLMQDEVYKYLHYFDGITINEGKKGKYDILYKRKKIEIKFSLIYNKEFQFYQIKPENFDFLLLIGLGEKDNFYFCIKSKEEYEDWKKNIKNSKNGEHIGIPKNSADFNFGNHLTIEDIDNYIESHSN